EDTWTRRVIDDHALAGVNGVHALLVADVNRDGKPDLIANSAEDKGAWPKSLAWFEAPDWTRRIFALGDAPGLSHYLGFGDVNGDDRSDIASAAKIGPEGNWFAWWEAPRDPRARWTKHIIATGHEGASNIAVADVNGDGKPDFVATRGHGKGVLWFEAPSWTVHDIDGAHQYPHSLATADLDRDGDVDAAACSAVYGTVPEHPVLAWFENDGRGRFTTHRISDNQAAYDVKLVDMDRDGDLDVLVAGQESRNVIWYENRLRRR
ncbi:MAG TPA: VCBS repeat-containing protein, partial [Bryobacteraceae bacterium]|nr:VCBS repeat-containing protein [Bryobacteraceae bacterium]